MKKQNNAKKVNKPLSKKVAPFVMSTSMMAATFLAAGAPISAAELEGKGVTSEVIEQAKNHGEEVSQLAKNLPGSPEKGQLVSELAKDKSEKIIEESASDDLATEEGGEAAEAPAEPIAEEDETSDDTAEAPAEPIAEEDETSDDMAEAPAEPVAEEDETSDGVAEAPAEPIVEGETSDDAEEAEEKGETSDDTAEAEDEGEASDDETPEVTEEVKNHGEEVSQLAKNLPGSPEKGQLVSELAKDKSFKTEKDEAEDKTEENNNDDVATEESEASDDVTEAQEVEEDETVAPEETATDTETSNEETPVDETTVENDNQEEGTNTESEVLNQVGNSSNTWVDDTYQVIGYNYQSLIGYYHALIDQYFGQTGSEQANNEAQQSDVEQSTDDSQESDSEQTTEDDSTVEVNEELATTVDNTEIEAVNNTAVSIDNQVDLEDDDSQVVQAEVEQDANVNLEQPELIEDEVSSEDETVNQNEQDLNQEEEVEKDPSNENSVKDKLIGYYQDLVASFSNFMSFLK